MATASTNIYLAEALRLAKLGLRIVPNYGLTPPQNHCSCSLGAECGSAGKHPWLINWPTEATTDWRTIRGWWKGKYNQSNVGIATGRGLVVIDIDNWGGKTGSQTLRQLEEQYGELPKLWTVRSGSGHGHHYYFSVPGGIEIPSCDTWEKEGLEIKGAGAQVVSSPSLHNSLYRYAWLSQVGKRAPLLPDRWIDAFKCGEKSNGSSSSSDPAAAESTAQKHHPQIDPIVQILVSGLSGLSGGTSTTARDQMLTALQSTIPKRKGERNNMMIDLSHRLNRIMEVKDKDAEWFEPAIRAWLKAAEGYIGSRDFPQTMKKWTYMWGIWLKDYLCETPLIRAREHMATSPDPPLPKNGYRSRKARELVKLCASMQATTLEPNGIWWISTRDAAREIGDDPGEGRKLVSGIFRQMVKDGILIRICPSCFAENSFVTEKAQVVTDDGKTKYVSRPRCTACGEALADGRTSYRYRYIGYTPNTPATPADTAASAA